jgi:RNA polymerase primary sigma factor
MKAAAPTPLSRSDEGVIRAAELLIKRGKEQGRLTPDEVLLSLGAVRADPDQAEPVFQLFREMGIEVRDDDGDTDEYQMDAEPVATAAVDSSALDAPIRMYLK